jgi:hypothetical protein
MIPPLSRMTALSIPIPLSEAATFIPLLEVAYDQRGSRIVRNRQHIYALW